MDDFLKEESLSKIRLFLNNCKVSNRVPPFINAPSNIFQIAKIYHVHLVTNNKFNMPPLNSLQFFHMLKPFIELSIQENTQEIYYAYLTERVPPQEVKFYTQKLFIDRLMSYIAKTNPDSLKQLFAYITSNANNKPTCIMALYIWNVIHRANILTTNNDKNVREVLQRIIFPPNKRKHLLNPETSKKLFMVIVIESIFWNEPQKYFIDQITNMITHTPDTIAAGLYLLGQRCLKVITSNQNIKGVCFNVNGNLVIIKYLFEFFMEKLKGMGIKYPKLLGLINRIYRVHMGSFDVKSMWKTIEALFYEPYKVEFVDFNEYFEIYALNTKGYISLAGTQKAWISCNRCVEILIFQMFFCYFHDKIVCEELECISQLIKYFEKLLSTNPIDSESLVILRQILHIIPVYKSKYKNVHTTKFLHGWIMNYAQTNDSLGLVDLLQVIAMSCGNEKNDYFLNELIGYTKNFNFHELHKIEIHSVLACVYSLEKYKEYAGKSGESKIWSVDLREMGFRPSINRFKKDAIYECVRRILGQSFQINSTFGDEESISDIQRGLMCRLFPQKKK